MLTYEHDDSDSDAVREAKLRVYGAQRDLADSMQELTRRVADAQQSLADAQQSLADLQRSVG